MKSMPASSAMRASCRQSGQLADQRSGTLVAVRLPEQLAPNMPILSALPLYIAMRSRCDAIGAGKALSGSDQRGLARGRGLRLDGIAQPQDAPRVGVEQLVLIRL